MKQKTLIAITFSMLLITFFSCKKESSSGLITDPGNNNTSTALTVEEKNTALVNKLTATWCGPCGQWGWAWFENAMSQNGTDAVYMGTYGDQGIAYNNLDFYNSVADTFKKAFAPTAGWPALCTNGKNKTVYDLATGGIYTDASLDSVHAAVQNHKSSAVIANANYTTTMVTADSIKIDVTTKFFQTGTGDYYVGVYLTEDEVPHIQNTISGSPVLNHHKVIRGYAKCTEGGTYNWGYKLPTSNLPAGTVFNKIFAKKLASTWNVDKLKVVIVIWKKSGNKYNFINAFQKP